MTDRVAYRRANFALFVGSFITMSHIYMSQPLLPLFAREFNGLLLAGFPAIAMAYVGEEFPREKLAAAMGLYISGTPVILVVYSGHRQRKG